MNKMVSNKEVKTKAVAIRMNSKNKEDNLKKNSSCADRLCPIHGDNKLRVRGRVFEGIVIKKLPGRATIEFERMIKIPKYERFEKRKTKIQGRVSDCMKGDFEIGDLIQVSETRPVSKTIHFVVTKILRGENKYESSK